MLLPVHPVPAFAAGQAVRFGNIGKAAGSLATPIIKAAMENEKVKQLKKSGRLKHIILANVMGMAALFPALFFNPAIAQRIQQSGSDNISLAGIEQPADRQAMADKLLLTLQTNNMIGDRQLLFDLAGVGFVREVIAEGANDTEGKAVLKNGRTINVPLDDEIRRRLREEYDVPVVHSLAYGVPLDPKVAAGLAAALTNILLLSGLGIAALVKKYRPETPEEDALSDRFYIEAIGRFIVASQLGVTRTPITPATIKEETDLFDNVKPLTRDDIWKRMVVLPAGYIAEHNYYNGNVSAMSGRKPRDLMEVARVAVSEAGLCMDRNVNPLEIAGMSPAEQETLARELAGAAFEEARRILAQYSARQLDQLGEALQEIRDLTKEEGGAILRGEKTLEDIQSERSIFNRDTGTPPKRRFRRKG